MNMKFYHFYTGDACHEVTFSRSLILLGKSTLLICKTALDLFE